MRSRKLSPLAWMIFLLSAMVAGMLQFQQPKYYPNLVIEGPAHISVNFLMRSHGDLASCTAALERLSAVAQGGCPTCRTMARSCLEDLPDSDREILSEDPISVPSVHWSDGVITYSGHDPQAALAICRETARQGKSNGLQCFEPGSARVPVTPRRGFIDVENLGYAFLVLILAQLVTKLVCYLILRYERWHARISHDATDAGPQKFHSIPTPRVGGLAVMMGVVVSCVLLLALPQGFADKEAGLLLVAAMPAFLGGLVEDMTKKVGVPQRLFLTMLSGAAGVWLLGGMLGPIGLPGFDSLLQWAPFAFGFTIFAVAGATNSINLIDGYNGLASGFGIIVCSALAFVSAQLGDAFLLTMSLSMVGALLGFLVWNWPGGKIFLGDGGAYVLGFWISEISVLMCVRHPEVSVWFPMLLMIYPVYETLFSVYRRKVKRNANPGHPDAMHLHQLVYKRMVRIHIGTKCPVSQTKRNSAVSWYAWGASSAFALVAVLFWRYPHVLMGATVLFCVLYTDFYYRIVAWRSPAILRYRGRWPWRSERAAQTETR